MATNVKQGENLEELPMDSQLPNCGDNVVILKSEDNKQGQRLFPSYRLFVSLCCCVAMSMLTANSTSMSSAMLCMFRTDDKSQENNITELSGQGGKSPYLESWTFLWDSSTKEWVIASFFFGYNFMQIPAGIITTKFGPRRSIVAGLFGPAVFHFLSVPAARQSVYLLYFVRILAGMTTAYNLPGIYGIMANWCPINEVSFLLSIATMGSELGNSVSFALSTYSCEIDVQGGWPFVFYSLGFLNFITCLVFIVLISNSSASSRWINQREANYISSNSAYAIKNRNKRIPVREILTSAPVWAFICANIGCEWPFFVVNTQVGLFARQILELSALETSLVMSVSPISMLPLTCVLGYVSDVVTNRKILSVSNVRKMNQIVASVFYLVSMILFIFCKKEDIITFTVACLAAAVANSACYPGYLVIPGYLSPAHASFLGSLNLGISRWVIFLIPIITGQLTEGDSLDGWKTMFYITAGVLATFQIVFLLFGSAEMQPWALEPETEQVRTQKEHDESCKLQKVKSNSNVCFEEDHLSRSVKKSDYGSL